MKEVISHRSLKLSSLSIRFGFSAQQIRNMPRHTKLLVVFKELSAFYSAYTYQINPKPSPVELYAAQVSIAGSRKLE